MEIKCRDIVKLKKPHPCGGDEWRIVKIGVDIGLQCLNCRRRVLIERRTLERKMKSLIRFDNGKERV